MILKHARLKAKIINMQYQFAPDYKKGSMKLASQCADTDIELMKVYVETIRANQLEQKQLPKNMEHLFLTKRFNFIIESRDKNIAEFSEFSNMLFQLNQKENDKKLSRKMSGGSEKLFGKIVEEKVEANREAGKSQKLDGKQRRVDFSKTRYLSKSLSAKKSALRRKNRVL